MKMTKRKRTSASKKGGRLDFTTARVAIGLFLTVVGFFGLLSPVDLAPLLIALVVGVMMLMGPLPEDEDATPSVKKSTPKASPQVVRAAAKKQTPKKTATPKKPSKKKTAPKKKAAEKTTKKKTETKKTEKKAKTKSTPKKTTAKKKAAPKKKSTKSSSRK